MVKKALNVLICALAIVMLSAIVMAVAPTGPESITVKDSQRRANFNSSVSTQQAQAGNYTQFEIATSLISDRWQAYFGNITGTITLDDGNKNTIYDWSDPSTSVAGNIFAANSTVNGWGSIRCVNLTSNGATNRSLWTTSNNDRGAGINQTLINLFYNATETDVDNIQKTFNTSVSITVNGVNHADCPGTHTYTNNATLITKWNQTLLTINATNTIIFATTVEQNTVGFDGRKWDFQMIVMENGDNS